MPLSYSTEDSIAKIRQEVSSIRSSTRLRILDPNDSYSISDLMGDLSSVVGRMISEVYGIEANNLFGPTDVPNFAIFSYGSPGRGEMTTHADIDLHIIDEAPNEKSAELKSRIVRDLETFGFSKVDDPNWENLETVEAIRDYKENLEKALDEFSMQAILSKAGFAVSNFIPHGKIWEQERRIQKKLLEAWNPNSVSVLDNAYYNIAMRFFNSVSKIWKRLITDDFGRSFVMTNEELLKAIHSG